LLPNGAEAWVPRGALRYVEGSPVLPAPEGDAERAVALSAASLVNRYFLLSEQSDRTNLAELERRSIGLKAARALCWLFARNPDPSIRAIAARYEER
jgi:hypothetical protein